MILSLSPTRSDDTLILDRRGDVQVINGEAFDFGPLPEGGTLPQAAVACPYLASDVTRTGGVLRLMLLLPLDPDAPDLARFPADVVVLQDGPITLPGQEDDL